MPQTPIQEKILESADKYCKQFNFPPGGQQDAQYRKDMLALASYIKEEVVPEEPKQGHSYTEDNIVLGFKICHSKVVDKFKEMGV